MKPLVLRHAFDPKRYSELRRRVVRRALRRWSRAGDAAMTLGHGLDAAEVRSVLICRPNHRLGNLLLLTPLVAELQLLLPHASVDIVLAGNCGAELFLTFPNVRHIYRLSSRLVRHPFATSRVAFQIRRAHYDLVIDPCETSQSGRLFVALAKPQHVLGLPRDGASAPAWIDDAPMHMGMWPVYLLRGALQHSFQKHGFAFPALDLRLADEERQRGREALDRLLGVGAPPRARTILGVFVEATGAKRLGLDWWRRFLQEVHAHHADWAIVEIVPVDGRPRLAPDVPGFGSPSPREVAAVIANMSGFVSADCGVMHLASAAGIPICGLFSASDIARYAPYGRGSQALLVNGKQPEDVAQAVGSFVDQLDPGSAPSVGGGREAQPKRELAGASLEHAEREYKP